MPLFLRNFALLQAPEDDAATAAARARGDFLDDDTPDPEPDTAPEVKDEIVDMPPDDKKVEAEPEPEPEPKPKAKQTMIPKARLDAVLERTKKLEELLAEKEGKAPPTTADRVNALKSESDTLMDKYADALDKGDVKLATQLMNKVRELDRDIVRIEAAAQSARDRAMAVEQVRLDTLIDSLEEKYPQLREGADEFDQDLVDELQDLRVSFEARGMASSEALKKAVKYVMRDEGVSQRQLNKDVENAEREADKAAEKAAKAKNVEQTRKAEAVQRNLKVAGKTPADLTRSPGLDSHKAGGGFDEKAVSQMTDEEFAALPDATKRKLRGDYVTAD